MSTSAKKAASPDNMTNSNDMGSHANSEGGSKLRRFFHVPGGRKNKVESSSPKNKTVISPASAAPGKSTGTQPSSSNNQVSSGPAKALASRTITLSCEKAVPIATVKTPSVKPATRNDSNVSAVKDKGTDEMPKGSVTNNGSFAKPKSSWLTRTRAFKQLCESAFDLVDSDNSGTVDEKELYSGLLLIHLKLGMYAGPAACRPLGRERVAKVFDHFDDDNSGLLDKKEFEGVMMVLFSNVLFRVLVQWSMTIIIVPLVASRVLELFYQAAEFLFLLVTQADEYFDLANAVELSIESAATYVWERVPDIVVFALLAVAEAWEAVPDSVWNAAPLALISTVLGILVVPWTIIKVDDFFLKMAERADTDRSGYSEVKKAL